MASRQQQLRNLVLDKWLQNPNRSQKTIANSVGVTQQTVSNVISKFLQTKSIQRKPTKRSKRGTRNKQNEKQVVKVYKRKPNMSVRDVAKKVNVAKSTVQDIKVRCGLRSFKAQKKPRRDDKGLEKAKSRARKLYDSLLTKHTGCIVQDDETYVKADFSQIPGNKFYTTKDRGSLEPKFKEQKIEKFAKKYLVWQAICTCGKISQPFISTGNINSEIYIKECLQKRLLPLLKQHSQNTLFWPDLASCHYSNATKKWYEENNVIVVPRDINPPNCPELRPIEKFWAIMKADCRKMGGESKSVQNFKQKWTKAYKTRGEKLVQTLMAGVKSKVRKFGREGEI